MASMRVRVQPASHGGHYEQYSPFQSAMCKRWDTPQLSARHAFERLRLLLEGSSVARIILADPRPAFLDCRDEQLCP